MEEAKLKITGRVQGVFYRANASNKALELGLSGYCKNLPDGSVEALVQGPRPAIEKFIEWCQQGPPSATVDKISVSWQTSNKIIEGFTTH